MKKISRTELKTVAKPGCRFVVVNVHNNTDQPIHNTVRSSHRTAAGAVKAAKRQPVFDRGYRAVPMEITA